MRAIGTILVETIGSTEGVMLWGYIDLVDQGYITRSYDLLDRIRAKSVRVSKVKRMCGVILTCNRHYSALNAI